MPAPVREAPLGPHGWATMSYRTCRNNLFQSFSESFLDSTIEGSVFKGRSGWIISLVCRLSSEGRENLA